MDQQQANNTFKTPRMVPPLWLLLSFVSMWALDKWLPLLDLWEKPINHIGSAFIIIGLVLNGWAAARFLLVKTGLIPFTPVTSLVKTGPFRISRNPMYLGMLSIALGAAILFGSLSPFAVLPIFFIIIRNRFVIPEEAMLEQVLGAPYLEFKAETRRWL
ncbi:MAG: isoprenylcysteine carboxylmethyltransferase family protein [Xanthomonadales bacterium]|nr:isoprenylcysteine carboxylmethyltransferase family protein [Xanthomonadales bacterium]